MATILEDGKTIVMHVNENGVAVPAYPVTKASNVIFNDGSSAEDQVKNFIPLNQKGEPYGVATLNDKGYVTSSQLPLASSTTDGLITRNDQAKLDRLMPVIVSEENEEKNSLWFKVGSAKN